MYISYSEAKCDEKIRKTHNEKYIEETMKTEQEYFENMFKNIDNNIKLDEEQKRIIITDEDNIMVIAGAGSGKTTTITAKVNYLIEKQNIKDDEIIIISFTNKAVEELSSRINKDFKHNVKIMTFHKFGYEIIKKSKTNPPKINSTSEMILKDYIEKEIINNKKELKRFLDLYTNYINIPETSLIYKNYDQYLKYKIKEKYPTLKHKLEYLNNQDETKTIKKEYTQTQTEKLIADYLYLNKIEYDYKKPYHKKEKYIPDFTIKYNQKQYYIEQFNIKENQKTLHKKNIKKIEKIHNKNNTILIKIYEGNIIKQLKEELQKNNIKTNSKTETEIFNKIIKENDKTYDHFIKLCQTYISLFKSKGYKYKEFKNIIQKDERTKQFVQFIKKMYIYYQQTLKKNKEIDFDDIINEAITLVEQDEQPKIKYKYIIIDEYQDISQNRYNLIKTITKKINNKTMIVGDDWQCIYSFASSNINLFTQFNKNVEYCEIMKITNTYRNSQELIDIAGEFIQKNNRQIKKKLKSNKTLQYPITIIKYNKHKLKNKLAEALEYLIKKYGTQKTILILGRYTFDKNKIIDNETIIENNNKITYKKYPEVKIEYMTVHSAKGLGYDNVIIINNNNEIFGFPSKVETDPILKQFITTETNIDYAEERRLFYVALTRTKNETLIMTQKNRESIFVKEIQKHKNIKIKK